MKIYLVGGAVRDELLGLPIKERDWVVVGATPEKLAALGYIAVGKEFPVFLHPRTKEEYALARTERKVGKGYKGFVFYTSPDVSLEEDLIRRDLTINAMAKSDAGELIDPFGGRLDLEKKILRHVSPAFVEDPVRILRIARFAAKFGEFSVAAETNLLMRVMVEKGEVNALVPERVWQEFARALQEEYPQRFFEVLHDCGALEILFPEIQLSSAGMLALSGAVKLHTSGRIRLSALLHGASFSEIKVFCKRLRVPNEYADLALLTAQWFEAYQNILTVDAETILALLKSVDAFRRPERYQQFLLIIRSILASKNIETIDQCEHYLNEIYENLKTLNIHDLLQSNLSGKDLAEKIHSRQIERIKKIKSKKL